MLAPLKGVGVIVDAPLIGEVLLNYLPSEPDNLIDLLSKFYLFSYAIWFAFAFSNQDDSTLFPILAFLELILAKDWSNSIFKTWLAT